MTQEKIQRINELAKKAKDCGLTDEEKAERAALRREYIDGFKSNLQQTLENTYVVSEDGEKRKLTDAAPKQTLH